MASLCRPYAEHGNTGPDSTRRAAGRSFNGPPFNGRPYSPTDAVDR